MFGASAGALTGWVKDATDPSSVRFVTPSNGCGGRGRTVRSHSVSEAATAIDRAVTASAIALQKMIHFRILIPFQNLRGYMRDFQSTRQNLERRALQAPRRLESCRSFRESPGNCKRLRMRTLYC